jgi:hypothetical protein
MSSLSYHLCQSVLSCCLFVCLSQVLFIPRGNFYFQTETSDRFIENSTTNEKIGLQEKNYCKIRVQILKFLTDLLVEFVKKTGNSKVNKLFKKLRTF